MHELNDLISPTLTRAIGFTLIHSLWQGAVITLAVSVLLSSLRRLRAHARYQLQAWALVSILVTTSITFVHTYRTAIGATAKEEYRAVLGNSSTSAPLLVHHAADYQSGLQGYLSLVASFAESNMPLVVVGWFLGMLAMSLRLLGGLAYVQRLRRHRAAELPASWQGRLDELCARAGLTQRVQLLASALVPSPVVVGYFKPVILLPLSAVTGLSMRDLEMILAHEVAHVARRDYLFNLLQSVAEVVFFYHPAVWFLSANLRTERENCCDDMAAQLSGDPRALALALSSLAELEYTARLSQLALRAHGAKGELVGRVSRLLQGEATPPCLSVGLRGACLSLVLIAFVAGAAASRDSQGAEPERNTFRKEAYNASAVEGVPGVPVLPLSYPPTSRPIVRASSGQHKPGREISQRTTRRLTNKQRDAGSRMVTDSEKRNGFIKNASQPEHRTPVTTLNGSVEQQGGNQLAQQLEQKMLQDGLIQDPRFYSYTLNAREFIVNGQKQSEVLWRRYRHLYETFKSARNSLPTATDSVSSN